MEKRIYVNTFLAKSDSERSPVKKIVKTFNRLVSRCESEGCPVWCVQRDTSVDCLCLKKTRYKNPSMYTFILYACLCEFPCIFIRAFTLCNFQKNALSKSFRLSILRTYFTESANKKKQSKSL